MSIEKAIGYQDALKELTGSLGPEGIPNWVRTVGPFDTSSLKSQPLEINVNDMTEYTTAYNFSKKKSRTSKRRRITRKKRFGKKRKRSYKK